MFQKILPACSKINKSYLIAPIISIKCNKVIYDMRISWFSPWLCKLWEKSNFQSYMLVSQHQLGVEMSLASHAGFYGHPVQQMRTVYFVLCLLSRRRLDVYHTSTHDVALVQIYNACLKCAARGFLKIQDAKNRHLCTTAQLCPAISSQLRHVSTIGKKLVK